MFCVIRSLKRGDMFSEWKERQLHMIKRLFCLYYSNLFLYQCVRYFFSDFPLFINNTKMHKFTSKHCDFGYRFRQICFSSYLSWNHFYQTCYTEPCKTITLEVIFHFYIHVNIINKKYILLLFRRNIQNKIFIRHFLFHRTITVQDTNGYNFFKFDTPPPKKTKQNSIQSGITRKRFPAA